MLVASRLLARPLVGRAEREQSTLATATAAATDLVTGLRVLKGIGAEPAAAAGYARASQTALRARLAAVTVEGGFLGATTALTGLLLVVVAWVAGRLALAGTISIGELVAAVGLAQFLIEPLEGLTRLGPLVAGARGCGRPGGDAAGARRRRSPRRRWRFRARSKGAAWRSGIGISPSTWLRGAPRRRDHRPEHGGGAARRPGPRRGARRDAAARRDRPGDRHPGRGPAALLVARHDAALFEGTLADNLADRRIPIASPGPRPGRLGGRRGPRHHARRSGYRDRRAGAYVVRRPAAAGRAGPRAGRRAGGAGAARPDDRDRRRDRGPDRHRAGALPRRADDAAGHLQPRAAGPRATGWCWSTSRRPITAEGRHAGSGRRSRATIGGAGVIPPPSARGQVTLLPDRHRPPDLAGQRGPAPRQPVQLALTLATLLGLRGRRRVRARPARPSWSTSSAVPAAARRVDLIALGLLVALLARAVFTGLGQLLLARLGEQVLARLRERVVRRALDTPLDTVERAGTGDLVQRTGGDITVISEGHPEALPAVVMAVIDVVLTLVGLTVLDWRLGLAGLAPLPIWILATRWYLRTSGPRYAAERAADGAQTQSLVSSLTGAATVRAFRLQARHLRRIRETSDAAVRAGTPGPDDVVPVRRSCSTGPRWSGSCPSCWPASSWSGPTRSPSARPPRPRSTSPGCSAR